MRKKQWSKRANDLLKEIEVNRAEASVGDLFFCDDKKANSIDKKEHVKNAVTPKLSQHEYEKIKKMKNLDIKKPKTEINNAVSDLWEGDISEVVPMKKSVTIHSGMSYRPEKEFHSQLIENVASEELKKDYMYERKVETVLIPKAVTTASDVESRPTQLRIRKIKKDRNKEMVERYEQERRQQKLIRRKILNQLDHLPEILANLKPQKEATAKRKFKQIRDNVKIGKFRLNDPTPVQLQEQISSSLRQMPFETNPLKNMYMNLIKNEKIDFSKFRLNRKKRKTKEITKMTHRIN
eukprot:NODE_202_length_13094_cov_1.571528.p7 type:complete len:294 gc:universal NODE_202_length_13094_cov_1.571528:8642-9523(+)